MGLLAIEDAETGEMLELSDVESQGARALRGTFAAQHRDAAPHAQRGGGRHAGARDRRVVRPAADAIFQDPRTETQMNFLKAAYLDSGARHECSWRLCRRRIHRPVRFTFLRPRATAATARSTLRPPRQRLQQHAPSTSDATAGDIHDIRGPISIPYEWLWVVYLLGGLGDRRIALCALAFLAPALERCRPKSAL